MHPKIAVWNWNALSGLGELPGYHPGQEAAHRVRLPQAFHVVDAAAPYLSKRFVAANFAFRGRTMSGVAEQPERWKRAVATVNGATGQAIGRDVS
jgi:predicted metalloendopeptidase